MKISDLSASTNREESSLFFKFNLHASNSIFNFSLCASFDRLFNLKLQYEKLVEKVQN
eukprot:UN02881